MNTIWLSPKAHVLGTSFLLQSERTHTRKEREALVAAARKAFNSMAHIYGYFFVCIHTYTIAYSSMNDEQPGVAIESARKALIV